MDFAQRLAFLLERDKVSRGKLARAVEVHTSTVTNWLSGMEPKLEKLVKVASFFSVPVAYLTGDTDDPSDKSLTHWADIYYANDPNREDFEIGKDGLPFYVVNKKSSTPSGVERIPGYSDLNSANQAIIDNLIAQLLAAQSDD